jgi:isopropylmalate/homocitrate/citramalate synthase
MQLEIYDTTLRDGSQQEGISLTVNDKLRIARLLDELGGKRPITTSSSPMMVKRDYSWPSINCLTSF